APVEGPARRARAPSAVEQSLAAPDLRAMAADMLRPVYERMGEYDELAALQQRVADWAEDPASKLRALAEVVRLREHRLGDKAAAFVAQLQMLTFSAAEPELSRVIAETERLATELEREGDL